MKLPVGIMGKIFSFFAFFYIIFAGFMFSGCSTPGSSFLQGAVVPVTVNIGSGVYSSSGFDSKGEKYVKIDMF